MIHLRFAKQISISISAADFHFSFLLVSFDRKVVLRAFVNDSFSNLNKVLVDFFQTNDIPTHGYFPTSLKGIVDPRPNLDFI